MSAGGARSADTCEQNLKAVTKTDKTKAKTGTLSLCLIVSCCCSAFCLDQLLLDDDARTCWTSSANLSAKASQDDLPKGNAAVSDPATYR